MNDDLPAYLSSVVSLGDQVHLGHIAQLVRRAQERWAHIAHSRFTRHLNTASSTSLGGTVAFQNVAAEANSEEVQHFGRDGRRAGDDELGSTA